MKLENIKRILFLGLMIAGFGVMDAGRWVWMAYGFSNRYLEMLQTTVALSWITLAVAPLLGYFSDRLWRRLLLAISLVGGIVIALVATSPDQPWKLWLVVLGYQVLFAAMAPVVLAFICDNTAENMRLQGVGLFVGFSAIVSGLGLFLFRIASTSWWWPFGLAGLLFVGALILFPRQSRFSPTVYPITPCKGAKRILANPNRHRILLSIGMLSVIVALFGVLSHIADSVGRDIMEYTNPQALLSDGYNMQNPLRDYALLVGILPGTVVILTSSLLTKRVAEIWVIRVTLILSVISVVIYPSLRDAQMDIASVVGMAILIFDSLWYATLIVMVSKRSPIGYGFTFALVGIVTSVVSRLWTEVFDFQRTSARFQVSAVILFAAFLISMIWLRRPPPDDDPGEVMPDAVLD